MHIISATPSAVTHIEKMIAKQGSGIGMRLSVKDSGCSGKKYEVSIINDHNKNPDDKLYDLNNNGLILCVDPVSFAYLAGTVIDYEIDKKTLSGKLVFNNPNQKAACGCGESFHV